MSDFSGSGLPLRRFGGFRTDSSLCHQLSSHQEQVAERKQREQLGTVLGQSPVAGLYVAELALDDAEGVATAVVASIGDISRFASPEKLASYFGLTPRVRQSGGLRGNEDAQT